jgi:hypothetical protein
MIVCDSGNLARWYPVYSVLERQMSLRLLTRWLPKAWRRARTEKWLAWLEEQPAGAGRKLLRVKGAGQLTAVWDVRSLATTLWRRAGTAKT